MAPRWFLVVFFTSFLQPPVECSVDSTKSHIINTGTPPAADFEHNVVCWKGGDVVEITGLLSKAGAELNGQIGRLGDFDHATGRWQVVIPGRSGPPLGIKPNNILTNKEPWQQLSLEKFAQLLNRWVFGFVVTHPLHPQETRAATELRRKEVIYHQDQAIEALRSSTTTRTDKGFDLAQGKLRTIMNGPEHEQERVNVRYNCALMGEVARWNMIQNIPWLGSYRWMEDDGVVPEEVAGGAARKQLALATGREFPTPASAENLKRYFVDKIHFMQVQLSLTKKLRRVLPVSAQHTGSFMGMNAPDEYLVDTRQSDEPKKSMHRLNLIFLPHSVIVLQAAWFTWQLDAGGALELRIPMTTSGTPELPYSGVRLYEWDEFAEEVFPVLVADGKDLGSTRQAEQDTRLTELILGQQHDVLQVASKHDVKQYVFDSTGLTSKIRGMYYRQEFPIQEPDAP